MNATQLSFLLCAFGNAIEVVYTFASVDEI